MARDQFMNAYANNDPFKRKRPGGKPFGGGGFSGPGGGTRDQHWIGPDPGYNGEQYGSPGNWSSFDNFLKMWSTGQWGVLSNDPDQMAGGGNPFTDWDDLVDPDLAQSFGYDNYYDWYQGTEFSPFGSGGPGGAQGGLGDLGMGSTWAGGLSNLPGGGGGGMTGQDCATLGPQFNSAGQCIACCEDQYAASGFYGDPDADTGGGGGTIPEGFGECWDQYQATMGAGYEGSYDEFASLYC